MICRSLLLVILLTPVVAQACPDLSRYLQASAGAAPDWALIGQELEPYFEQCLTSSPYFSLRGAAQLNTGRLPEAIESLERALLLDPDNGAAMVDYAQALLEDGQLFAAIEANRLVLARDDAPDRLLNQIAARERDWGALTRQTSYQIDLVGGYDDNLNGGPDEDLIALTLAGEPILLTLSQNLRAASGPFANLRGLVRHRQLAPGRQHNFLGQLSGRLSEDTASDVLQVNARYSQTAASGERGRQFGAGVNHLAFGGNSLFTGADTRFRWQTQAAGVCRPYVAGALQHQTWHGQELLNGLESKLSFGGDCAVAGRANQRLGMESSVLYNAAQASNRLGGDRAGWQFRAQWQVLAAGGLIAAQLDHTTLADRRGYSQLLADNARRRISRNSVLVQYRRRLGASGADLLINFYHQDQGSSLSLFRTEDTSLEMGLSWRF